MRALLGLGTVTGRFGGLGSPPTAPSSTLCGVSLPDMLGDPEQNKHKVHSVHMHSCIPFVDGFHTSVSMFKLLVYNDYNTFWIALSQIRERETRSNR